MCPFGLTEGDATVQISVWWQAKKHRGPAYNPYPLSPYTYTNKVENKHSDCVVEVVTDVWLELGSVLSCENTWDTGLLS